MINWQRIAKYQLVVWLGTVVNLFFLWLFRGVLELPLLLAGALAIEIAIIHNFTWHYHVTWRGAVELTMSDFFHRLLHYNAVTVSIDFVVNLGILWLLTSQFGFHYLVADFLGKLAGPVLKYLANELLIFRKKTPI